MIQDEGKYYLYRHIRCDKNEPFYIGIGTKKDLNHKSIETEYKRAYSKHRSKFWKNITEKSEYNVEIVLESNDLDFICQKEREMIALYGRRLNNTGTLVNFETGGQKGYNTVITENHKKNISVAVKKAMTEGKGLLKTQFKKGHDVSKAIAKQKELLKDP